MSTAASPVPRRPNPILILVRVMVVTVAFAVLGGGVGALMGIIGVAVTNAAGVPTDMQMAICAGAMPGAAISAVVGLVVIIVSERKHARAA